MHLAYRPPRLANLFPGVFERIRLSWLVLETTFRPTRIRYLEGETAEVHGSANGTLNLRCKSTRLNSHVPLTFR